MLKILHTLIVLELNVFQKKIENLLEINVITNMYRIQVYDSIMCGCICIRIIDFMVKGKSLEEV